MLPNDPTIVTGEDIDVTTQIDVMKDGTRCISIDLREPDGRFVAGFGMTTTETMDLITELQEHLEEIQQGEF